MRAVLQPARTIRRSPRTGRGSSSSGWRGNWPRKIDTALFDKGFGEDYPKEKNSDEAGRAANRRVIGVLDTAVAGCGWKAAQRLQGGDGYDEYFPTAGNKPSCRE